jgi:GT2 family glycosyltransferase
VSSTVPAGPIVTPRTSELPVTVVICAYTEKRWNDLLAAVDSVYAQLLPGDELIVIIDHNAELLERTTTALATTPDVRVLANRDAVGLSGARNTGVQASRGAVVAFLDDDATARPGWLAKLRKAFVDDDAVAAAGTAVRPRWEGGRPPRWFPPEFGWVVGCDYRGLPTTRSTVRNPIGASMAVRRTAFTVAGGFSDLVGRVGALPVGCEETEFCIRVAAAVPGAVVVHEPASAVDHSVPAARQTLRYFVHRCYHEGRSKWAVAQLGGAKAGLSAERRYVRVVLPTGVAAGLSRGLTRLDPFALARSAVIVIGLSSTLIGFGACALQGPVTRARSALRTCSRSR